MMIPPNSPLPDGRCEQQRDAFVTRFVADFDKAVELNATAIARQRCRELEAAAERAAEQYNDLFEANQFLEARLSGCEHWALHNTDDDLIERILAEVKMKRPEKKRGPGRPSKEEVAAREQEVAGIST